MVHQEIASCLFPLSGENALTASDLIRRLHQHRMWVNHRLLKAVRPLTDEQLWQPFAIGQGAVWRTLTHLPAAEYVWLEDLVGNDSAVMPGDVRGNLPGNQEGEGAILALDKLVSRRDELDQRRNRYLDSLTDDDLDGIVSKTSTSSRLRHGTRQADVLLQVCTHAQYATAQLVNMLRKPGVTPLPDVMLISLARQEAST